MTDWSEIVQQHGPTVWRTALRLLNNESDAADCFQGTFVSALELSRNEAVRNWPALLKHLVTARSLERLRQRRRAGDRMTVLSEGIVDTRTVEPIEAAIAGELAGKLREALAELAPKQSQVVCLACLEGFSYREIADQLGMPVSSVGSLLNKARLILRDRLRPRGPSPTRDACHKETQP